MAEVVTKRVRCLLSEVAKECDLEDVVRHNTYRFQKKLNRKPYLAFYSTINAYHLQKCQQTFAESAKKLFCACAVASDTKT